MKYYDKLILSLLKKRWAALAPYRIWYGADRSMLRRELGNLVYKGGVPVIIAIITLIIGIPGAIWATIQIISYRKNKDRHDSSSFWRSLVIKLEPTPLTPAGSSLWYLLIVNPSTAEHNWFWDKVLINSQEWFCAVLLVPVLSCCQPFLNLCPIISQQS